MDVLELVSFILYSTKNVLYASGSRFVKILFPFPFGIAIDSGLENAVTASPASNASLVKSSILVFKLSSPLL